MLMLMLGRTLLMLKSTAAVTGVDRVNSA